MIARGLTTVYHLSITPPNLFGNHCSIASHFPTCPFLLFIFLFFLWDLLFIPLCFFLLLWPFHLRWIFGLNVMISCWWDTHGWGLASIDKSHVTSLHGVDRKRVSFSSRQFLVKSSVEYDLFSSPSSSLFTVNIQHSFCEASDASRNRSFVVIPWIGQIICSNFRM